MSERTVEVDLSEGILTLTLNRPERLNAFNARMLGELLTAFDEADRNDDVRVVLVTGAGRAFCAGADLGRGGTTFDRSDTESIGSHRDGGGVLALRIFECRKPVIAAINGAAVGVGITMCLPMDVRLASERAKFGFVFVRRGIVPEAASSWFLPRIVGIGRALDWVVTGRVFPAAEALEGGLVSRVVPADGLLPAARSLAREVAENTSAVSVALSRQLLWRMLGADHPMEAHKLDSKGIFAMGQSPDAREGVASFLEKRPPRFGMKVTSHMPPFFPWWQERSFED